jgi:hypothetical protein
LAKDSLASALLGFSLILLKVAPAPLKKLQSFAPHRHATKTPPRACLIYSFPMASLELAWIPIARLHFPIAAIASTPKTKQESSMPAPKAYCMPHAPFS